MASESKFSGLTRTAVTVLPYSVANIEFNTPFPNYYRVQNMGAVKLYCGTSSTPTTSRYDFAVNAEKIKLYAEPKNKANLYIFNPSGSPVDVVVTSFAADFDPSTMALTDLEVDLASATIETSTVISGFGSALPTGGNVIGKVGIDGAIPAGSNKIGNVGISGALPAGSNKIGSVDVVNFPTDYATSANQKDYNTILNSILSAIGAIMNSPDNVHSWSATGASEESVINASGDCLLHLLSNDGDTPITVTFTNSDNTTSDFILKAGETVQDLRFNCGMKISGSNFSYRVIVSYP